MSSSMRLIVFLPRNGSASPDAAQQLGQRILSSAGADPDAWRRTDVAALPGLTGWAAQFDAANVADADAARGRVARALREESPADACSFLVPGEVSAPGKRLLVTDVDSTLIEQEVIEMLAAHAGREAEVAAITQRAMRGELDFEASLRERVKVLAGLPSSVVTDVADAVTPTQGAEELVASAHAQGHTVGAVSGGFIQVLAPLARRLGLDHARANTLEVRDGILTGELTGPIVDRAAKATALREWAAQDEVSPAATLALGDGANDADLLAAATWGAGVQPKPVLRQMCDGVLGLRRLDTMGAALGWLHG